MPDTTNNRMELQAIIEALRWVRAIYLRRPVKIFTDSQLSINVITGKWKAKKNLELVLEARGLMIDHGWNAVTLEWVRGHDFSLENNIADSLAYEAAQRGSEGTPMRRLKSV